MSQSYRTRAGWTTNEKPEPVDERPAAPPPAPSWVWAIVTLIAGALAALLIYVGTK